MSIQIRCPEGHLLKISSKYAGKKIRCPKCKQAVRIPVMQPSSEESDDQRAEESTPKPVSVPPPRKSRKSKEAKSRDSDRWKGNPEEATSAGPKPPPLPQKKSPAPVAEKPVAEPTPPPVEGKSKPTPTKPTPKPTPKPKSNSESKATTTSRPLVEPKVESQAASETKPKVDTAKQPQAEPKQKAEPPPKSKRKVQEKPATKSPQEPAKEPAPPPHADSTLEPVEAPPTAEELTDAKPTCGYRADEDKRVTVYGLALLMAVVAVITCIPSVWALVYNFQNELYQPRWIYLLLLLGSVQLAYGIFLAQVHDWSAAQVAMVFTALLTTFFAMGLGIATTSEADNEMLNYLGILFSGDRELDRLADGSMLSWCLIMTALNGLLTYFNSRVAFRWHKTYLIATSIPTEQTWEMEL